MRIPDSLATLHDYGIIDEVLRPLMSGKEAQIYLVTSGDKLCVAKIYKEAQNRSFKHRADYTEGRKVRNTRDQRAIEKRSKHGREQEEAAWRSTEVDVIYRLHAGGVRVPTPYHFVEGVLVMELVADAEGNPAPRLGDIPFEPEMATRIYHSLIREVVRMLCAGIVHGDLSDFNVLMGADGPVVIDFPQSVDTAHNTNARGLLIRDVDNLHRFLTRFVPDARRLPYAEEMWELHQNNALTPDTQLTGRYRSVQRQVNTNDVLGLIRDANHDERKRRDALGLRGGPTERETDVMRAPPQTYPRQGNAQQAYPRQGNAQQAYPRQGNAQQAYPRQGNAQQAYPQQGNAQQAYPRQGNAQQAYPRQGNAQQAYPQQGNAQQAYPRQGNAQQAYPQQGNAQQAYPRQGNAQQGNPRQAYPRQGNAQQAYPQQGNAQQAYPRQGNAQQAYPQQGNAQQAYPRQGNAQQGNPRQAYPRQGNAQQGNPQQGSSRRSAPPPTREIEVQVLRPRPKPQVNQTPDTNQQQDERANKPVQQASRRA